MRFYVRGGNARQFFILFFNHISGSGGTFGALWVSFWRTWATCWMPVATLFGVKMDWGSEGAPRGATLEIPSPIWAPFGSYFLHIFVSLMQKGAYLKHVAAFLQFWIALSNFGERLICNPYTPAQSKHTFQILHVFLKQAPQRVQNVFILSSFLSKNLVFVWKKVLQKLLQKRVPSQIQIGFY